ncbi:hypothetical protein FHT87_002420 [Rhizobium sp. BK316]|nr:hypothetical protein [Rhizobium sp. BK316]
MVRSSHGDKLMFTSPDILWNASVEYFAWVEANPLYETKAFASGGKVIVKELPKTRAMTISGLCIFLDIVRRRWDGYRAREDFTHLDQALNLLISM